MVVGDINLEKYTPLVLTKPSEITVGYLNLELSYQLSELSFPIYLDYPIKNTEFGDYYL